MIITPLQEDQSQHPGPPSGGLGGGGWGQRIQMTPGQGLRGTHATVMHRSTVTRGIIHLVTEIPHNTFPTNIVSDLWTPLYVLKTRFNWLSDTLSHTCTHTHSDNGPVCEQPLLSVHTDIKTWAEPVWLAIQLICLLYFQAGGETDSKNKDRLVHWPVIH